MRDNIRKIEVRHLPAVLGMTLALVAAPVGAQTRAKPATCPVSRGTLGERDQSTPELSTEQMEVAVAQAGKGVLLIDARPYEEFAMGHIPGAVNIAPKPGLPPSQFTSDLGEIAKVVRGKIDMPIVLYCNGPFCEKSKRVAADLKNGGYTHVTRYQLGIPMWRTDRKSVV